MTTPKHDFNFGLNSEMDIDFDTAYKNFEENFDEEMDEALNYNNEQSDVLISTYFDKIEDMPYQAFEMKTPEPGNFNQNLGFPNNFQPEFQQNNYFLTPTNLSLLNADKTPSKTQEHWINDNQSVISGTSSEIIQKDTEYFQQLQIQPSVNVPTQHNNSNITTGASDQNLLFPAVELQGHPNIKHLPNQPIMSVSKSPELYPKPSETGLKALPNSNLNTNFAQLKTDENNNFNLLSVKETTDLLNFLTKLETPEQPIKKPLSDKKKLSYDELLKKVDNIEKKLDAHKNKHKLSERKRRAVINERFNNLIELVVYPRNGEQSNKKSTRITKHQQLQYVIEDLEDVTKQNTDIESFLQTHQLMDHFELWKANLTK